MPSSAEVLTGRQLNRATLARQLLLERSSMSSMDAVEHLVGLQAQIPLDPYLALWSRLEGFDPYALGALIEDRSLVRIVVMRGTIHLLSARDALWLRPVTQPVLEDELFRRSQWGRVVKDWDLDPIISFARPLLADRQFSTTDLRSVLGERFPGHDPATLVYACRCLLPLIQAPPRGVWGKTRQVELTLLDSWVGKPLEPHPSLLGMIRRYLAAFGPASVADVTAWSRLTGLRAVVEDLRLELATFRSERGTEVFDLPSAPRPDPAIPAPIRFLPEYDNLLLSHADRSRFSTYENRRFTDVKGPIKGTVLVDGTVQAIWRFEKDKKTAINMVIEHWPLAKRHLEETEAEAIKLARFWHAGAEVSIVLAPIGSNGS